MEIDRSDKGKFRLTATLPAGRAEDGTDDGTWEAPRCGLATRAVVGPPIAQDLTSNADRKFHREKVRRHAEHYRKHHRSTSHTRGDSDVQNSYKHHAGNPVISSKIPEAFKSSLYPKKGHQEKSLPPQRNPLTNKNRIAFPAKKGLIAKKSVSPPRNKASSNAVAGKPNKKILVNASKLPHDFMHPARAERREVD